jgi:hypothetical protein
MGEYDSIGLVYRIGGYLPNIVVLGHVLHTVFTVDTIHAVVVLRLRSMAAPWLFEFRLLSGLTVVHGSWHNLSANIPRVLITEPFTTVESSVDVTPDCIIGPT